MKKLLLISTLQFICITISWGQYKVLLTENKSIKASDIEINDGSVVLTRDNNRQTFKKEDVLCIIPDAGKSFTFLERNGKKMKILKRDLDNNFQGEDIARLLAYKYYKSDVDIGQLYSAFPGAGLTMDEFEATFAGQQKKFKKRKIVSTSIMAVVLLITSGLLITTLAGASSIQ